VQQPLRYAAREWDATAGLYQVRARWYDPHTGRFVSEEFHALIHRRDNFCAWR
jgi:RHS repeat-associated protein